MEVTGNRPVRAPSGSAGHPWTGEARSCMALLTELGLLCSWRSLRRLPSPSYLQSCSDMIPSGSGENSEAGSPWSSLWRGVKAWRGLMALRELSRVVL